MAWDIIGGLGRLAGEVANWSQQPSAGDFVETLREVVLSDGTEIDAYTRGWIRSTTIGETVYDSKGVLIFWEPWEGQAVDLYRNDVPAPEHSALNWRDIRKLSDDEAQRIKAEMQRRRDAESDDDIEN